MKSSNIIEYNNKYNHYYYLEKSSQINIAKIINSSVADNRDSLSMNQSVSDQKSSVVTKPSRAKLLRKPAMFKVLLYNDSRTPMEFVVQILQQFFHMTSFQATKIMLNVHQKGVGTCGIFTYEIAETKKNQVSSIAKRAQYPLKCSLERV